MEIVFLEKSSLGSDMDISLFHGLGNVTAYDLTPQEQIPKRIERADIVVTNKLLMNEASLSGAEQLKMIAITATGTNMVDFAYTAKRGITVANVPAYSTDAVAQHTFALLLYILQKSNYYDHYVKSGAYAKSPIFGHFAARIYELCGKTWGIIGMGAIGRKVAEIATAFGCKVIYYSTTGNNKKQNYECVNFETLLAESDVVSIHAPLNTETEGMINRSTFAKMKNSAILINVARGAIVVEEDLAVALETGMIAGAGLDVLSTEPMRADNPLCRIKDSSKLIITPHMAWAPRETRQRLLTEVYRNMEAFIKGEKRNVIEFS